MERQLEESGNVYTLRQFLVNCITMITLNENVKHNLTCLNILVGIEYVIEESQHVQTVIDD